MKRNLSLDGYDPGRVFFSFCFDGKGNSRKMPSAVTNYSFLIKEEARGLGFNACGISRAGRLNEDAGWLNSWLEKRMHAGMDYMSRNFDKRVDPRLLVNGARSVVSVIMKYSSPHSQAAPRNPKISRYAWGTDYHYILKNKLKALNRFIQQLTGASGGRVFTDSAPVLERAWASAGGLGWIGKNSMLISPEHGSFVFIGEIITDAELPCDKPIPDYCGSCTRCIDACPTGAIRAPRLIDSTRCISYHTIEHRGETDPSMKGKFEGWVFGCDICQEVCPWNSKTKPATEPGFMPKPGLLEMSRKDWLGMKKEDFDRMFSDSPLKRTGYDGILRNIEQ